MLDREWMMNPQAIRTAKKCIALVKEEFGEKLTLSDPMFMQSLHQFAEKSKMRSLGTSYARLLSMAGVGEVIQNLLPKVEAEKQSKNTDIARSA